MMIKAPPDISICIANYNGATYICNCLDSIYAQTGPFNFEVLLHDDASTDNSVALVQMHYPSVRVLASRANVGFCVSNNRMAQIARGRYLLLINNDVILRPESLSKLFSFAEERCPECILGLPQYSLTDGTLIDRGYLTDLFLNPIPILEKGTHAVGVATGACLWIPRAIWDKIGGFPPWFGSVAEDIFVCLAARLFGHKVIVLEGPGFDHWIGRTLGGGKIIDSRIRTTAQRRALSERNKTATMLMCYPNIALLIILPLHIALLTIEALFLLFTGSSRDKIFHIYGSIPTDLWKSRREILSWRRHLQSNRSSKRSVFSMTRWLPQKLCLLIQHGKPEIK